ncbi:hypothetical protein J437_LFUL011064 [Ladona fulva]|uniref:Uncharacterized protein n=1 Tax=Ladona fulva TaxID=123851 RepID=A0A8K0P0F0_LADFU|nr:hypothetical protein J437_LFUL011064 [Ladona fulva]
MSPKKCEKWAWATEPRTGLAKVETRWKGNKAKELAEGYKLIYSGTYEKGRNGVGVIIDKD